MWRESHPDRPLPLFRSIWEDMLGRSEGLVAPESLAGRVAHAFNCLRQSGFRCSLNYRLAHSARGHLGAPGKLIAGSLFWWNRHFYNCSITPTARIHGGLCLPHPTGISVAPGAVVGPNAWIFQNVTITASPKGGVPQIGRHVAIYVGAVIAGAVHVGDDVVIGANAVVARNVHSGVLVVAPPAQEASLALLGHSHRPVSPKDSELTDA